METNAKRGSSKKKMASVTSQKHQRSLLLLEKLRVTERNTFDHKTEQDANSLDKHEELKEQQHGYQKRQQSLRGQDSHYNAGTLISEHSNPDITSTRLEQPAPHKDATIHTGKQEDDPLKLDRTILQLQTENTELKRQVYQLSTDIAESHAQKSKLEAEIAGLSTQISDVSKLDSTLKETELELEEYRVQRADQEAKQHREVIKMFADVTHKIDSKAEVMEDMKVLLRLFMRDVLSRIGE